VAAFAQFWGLETLWKIWTIEAAIAVFGLIGWLGIRWIRDRYPASDLPEAKTLPISAETGT
jgi:hypothetical protein